MAYTTLITTHELQAYLDDPNWVIIDCRFQLKDLEYGHRAYEQTHIAGAVYAHLNNDLSGRILIGKTGRHPLATIESAARKFSAWGINTDTQVVAYDDVGGALAAARLWWMLRWLGHDQSAVLDGGWLKWQKEGRPTRTRNEQHPAGEFLPRARPELVMDADDVLRAIGDPNFKLLDARTAERYRGENETIDPIAGHIPGAVSAPYLENLDWEGVFKSKEVLRAKYQSLLGHIPAGQSAVYCGSGVTAPLNILAMLHAGLGEAKLYAGSWSDWILGAKRPIKTGDENN
jgi:thiosulfate/3-mercaptopyruvate sulfurtransferase